jgi:hypothetical protein
MNYTDGKLDVCFSLFIHLRSILTTSFSSPFFVMYNIVWEKLKKERKSERQHEDAAEEYEDQHGNVFNKKTYDDLRRQGLL